MDSNILNALSVIATSVGIAFVFNILFFDKTIGISFFIITAILIGAVYTLAHYQKTPCERGQWLVPLILFFSFVPGIRANELLTFLNVCATFGLLILFAHELTGTPTILLKLYDYFRLVTIVPLRMLGTAASSLTMLTQIHSSVKHRDPWLQALKGVLMALPVLCLFGLLLSQADLAFSRFLHHFVDLTITDRMIEFATKWLFAFVASLSFLSYILFSQRPGSRPSSEEVVGHTPVKGIEVAVFLGLIAALFLLFIGFQVTYLFGGEMNIVKAGFTYAEYARQGFWELLAVASLSLIVLFVSEKYAGVEGTKDRRFLLPALLLIGEVGVLIASALKRLSLYIETYGMTVQRFYVAGFIVFLVALFILLAVKFITLKRESFFAFGSLLSVIAFLVAINLINPDAFIAKANLEQYEQTGKIDVTYVRTLSADAEPWKIALYKKMTSDDKESLQEHLVQQKERLEQLDTGWPSINLSRKRALVLISQLGI